MIFSSLVCREKGNDNYIFVRLIFSYTREYGGIENKGHGGNIMVLLLPLPSFQSNSGRHKKLGPGGLPKLSPFPVSPTFSLIFCIFCSSTKPKHCKVTIICLEWSSHYLSGIIV